MLFAESIGSILVSFLFLFIIKAKVIKNVKMTYI